MARGEALDTGQEAFGEQKLSSGGETSRVFDGTQQVAFCLEKRLRSVEPAMKRQRRAQP